MGTERVGLPATYVDYPPTYYYVHGYSTASEIKSETLPHKKWLINLKKLCEVL